MIGHFKLKGNETVIFTIDNTDVIYGRVYERDGKERDYESRVAGIRSNGMDSCFWDVAWDLDTCIINFYDLVYTTFNLSVTYIVKEFIYKFFTEYEEDTKEVRTM